MSDETVMYNWQVKSTDGYASEYVLKVKTFKEASEWALEHIGGENIVSIKRVRVLSHG